MVKCVVMSSAWDSWYRGRCKFVDTIPHGVELLIESSLLCSGTYSVCKVKNWPVRESEWQLRSVCCGSVVVPRKVQLLVLCPGNDKTENLVRSLSLAKYLDETETLVRSLSSANWMKLKLLSEASL